MSRRVRLLATVVLTAAAACPLHDLADALEAGRATAAPHEWPYAAACAAYSNATEETWCGGGVRNSSGLAALNAWSGGGYGAYRVAEECGAALPSCFVEADRETTAIKLTKLIDWGQEYEDDVERWDREISEICHAEIDYWQPHIGAYIGRGEFIEYAYTLSPKFNGESFLHSPIRIVDLTKGEGDWVMTYTWRTAAGFAGETLDGQPEETTILKLGFAETIGEEYKLTYTEFSRPTYEFMSRISMTPETVAAALALLVLLYGERRWRAVVAPATAPRDGLEAASGDGDSPRSPLSPSPRASDRARLTRSWSVAPLAGRARDPSLALAAHDAPRVGLLFRDLVVRARTRRGDGRMAHASPPALATAAAPSARSCSPSTARRRRPRCELNPILFPTPPPYHYTPTTTTTSDDPIASARR
jgi:hypothetical protein